GAVPFFHIIGLNAVMLVAMFYDSTVYLFPDPRKYGSILKAIEKYGINYFHGVPTLLKALLKYPDFSKFDVSSLEFVFSGAAPLDPKLGMDFEAKTNALVVEAYGMTETSPMVAANPFERENHQFGSIGLPFPDTEFKIVDPATHEDLPLGEIGEIALKGPQIMQGYLNNPEETANSFWDGYLLTGDLAQIKDDGFVYIVNRKKDMIISSGYKVFPSELEQLAMDNFPEFEEVVVIGSYDEHRGETVKLIAVLKEGAQISKENIIDFFKNRIAVYKIPKIIEFVKNLPKTSIGKTDRKALQEKERSLSTPPI
ncbi:MAG: long-chain fatty acid--CoA ligase, partial [Promethearchaeota archaeon]